jgi:hypothetical protein
VGRNLFDAISHLQYSDIAPAIWIDSICINQKDTAEKTIQVTKMGSIYSKTKNVIIWLGPRLKHSDAICGTIQQLPIILARRRGIDSGDRDDLIDAIADVKSHEEFVQLILECMLNSGEELADGITAQNFLLTFITMFSTIKWWRRAWIIQEFLLAKDCFFQLGLRRIGVDALGLSYISAIIHVFNPTTFSSSLRKLSKIQLYPLPTVTSRNMTGTCGFLFIVKGG